MVIIFVVAPVGVTVRPKLSSVPFLPDGLSKAYYRVLLWRDARLPDGRCRAGVGGSECPSHEGACSSLRRGRFLSPPRGWKRAVCLLQPRLPRCGGRSGEQ